MTTLTNHDVTKLALRTRPCPRCHAQPDEPCVSRTGREYRGDYTHPERRAELEEVYLKGRTDPRPLAWAEPRTGKLTPGQLVEREIHDLYLGYGGTEAGWNQLVAAMAAHDARARVERARKAREREARTYHGLPDPTTPCPTCGLLHRGEC